MMLNELKKRSTRFPDLQEMHDLPKFGNNYNRDLPKVSKLTAIDNCKLSKVRETT